MISRVQTLILTAAVVAFFPIRLRAETPGNWSEELIDHMAGESTLEGRISGMDVHHEVQAEWVLSHQFLRIHEKTAPAAPDSERRYEAIWFLGYDSVSDRYVLHLLDIFGGRFSETLGYGARDGDAIRFVFEYPDGPFKTTFLWSAKTRTWQWLMVQKDKRGSGLNLPIWS